MKVSDRRSRAPSEQEMNTGRRKPATAATAKEDGLATRSLVILLLAVSFTTGVSSNFGFWIASFFCFLVLRSLVKRLLCTARVCVRQPC